MIPRFEFGVLGGIKGVAVYGELKCEGLELQLGGGEEKRSQEAGQLEGANLL